VDKFAGHLADEYGWVMITEVKDGVVDTKLLDEGVFILGGIADGAQNAKKVYACNGLLMHKLLHRAGEDLRHSQRSSDGW
jgi:hypothetical protein